MIRKVITAAILFAAFISMASVAQVASAVEPELNLEISAYEDDLATADHPFAWTPDLAQQKRIIKLYERLILPKNIESSSFTKQNTVDQRLFSFEIYQGDGLDDLRLKFKHHNSLTLPDDDTNAYGVTVKQRF